jgi:dihydroorotate dehydrogenase
MKPDTPEAEQESKQPLIQIPDRHTSTSTAEKAAALPESTAEAPVSGTSPSTPPKLQAGEEGSTRDVAESALKMVTHTGGPPSEKDNAPSSSAQSQSSSKKTEKKVKTQDLTPKVIFATGGITNGEQCLQILNAGASVCQVYTAMMYGGVGTVTRIKSEMRSAMRQDAEKR